MSDELSHGWLFVVFGVEFLDEVSLPMELVVVAILFWLLLGNEDFLGGEESRDDLEDIGIVHAEVDLVVILGSVLSG